MWLRLWLGRDERPRRLLGDGCRPLLLHRLDRRRLVYLLLLLLHRLKRWRRLDRLDMDLGLLWWRLWLWSWIVCVERRTKRDGIS